MRHSLKLLWEGNRKKTSTYRKKAKSCAGSRPSAEGAGQDTEEATPQSPGNTVLAKTRLNDSKRELPPPY